MTSVQVARVLLPDGKPFGFWDDATQYRRVFHVAREHPRASDDNPGTAELPFATINRGAQILMPGEKLVVHQGVYRECVRPPRGGTDAEHMIAYEAAPGEQVQVRGSELLSSVPRPSEGWALRPTPALRARVWMADLPAEWFVGYNPFMATNMTGEFTTFVSDWSPGETRRLQLRRGMVFVDGRRLRQVNAFDELASTDGAFWVEDPGLRLHFRLWDDADPEGHTIEITTREQVFAPPVRGLGYIRVSGFRFEHAADGVPIPQRSAVSTARGHHWIIENNTIQHANASGIDVGNESWHGSEPEAGRPIGRHIIRRNTVAHCGAVGIQGVGCVDGTLVEDNVVEHIGGLNIERIWETGGLKFHTTDGVLIQRNVFRHLRDAPGVWLDYLNRNSRVTRNVFHDIESVHGAVYIEVSHAPNAVDHNVIWDIREPSSREYAIAAPSLGVNVDTGEQCIVANNLFGQIGPRYAVSANLVQSGRIVGGRVGLCRKHVVFNNVFVNCPKRIALARVDDNRSDGNLFSIEDDPASLCVETPSPPAILNLEAWQTYYGLDRSSAQAHIEAAFDPQTLSVTLRVKGALPACAAVPELGVEAGGQPGPVEIERDG